MKVNLFIDKFLKSEEIRAVYFTPHSSIALRTSDNQIELMGDIITANGSHRFFTEFMGESDLQELRLKRQLSKELKLETHLIAVEAFLSETGLTFSLTKKETLKTNIEDYPQIVANFLNAKSGLLIGVQRKTAEITRVERELFSQKLSFKPVSSLYLRTKFEMPFLHKNSFVMNLEKTEHLATTPMTEHVDVVRYGTIKTSEDVEKIKAYLMSGSFVMAHIQGAKVSEALVSLQALLTTWESRYFMSQALIGFYSFLSWSYNNQQNYAFEAYPFGTIAKSNFYSESSIDFFKFFENDFKNNGLSFSQSLHTKVLKRSIDLRKAFELAPDPSDLDYILKKSGL